MDKQTLRYSYLGYFASQYAKKDDIDFDTLENMAAGDNDLEKEVLKELINEGLIEGIDVFDDEHFSTITQQKGKLKLTAKGLKEILNIFPEEKEEIIADIVSGSESKNTNSIEINSIHEKLLQKIRQDFEFKSKNANTTKIKKIFNETAGSRYKAEKAIEKLKKEGYIKFSYFDDIASFCPNNLLTDKAINFLDKTNEEKLQKAIKDIGTPLPSTQEILEAIDTPKEIHEYIKKVEDRVKNEKEEKKRKNTPSITFSGILGQNCGEVVAPSGEDERRIQERGFKVENGIYVLRGFAKASMLAAASTPEYQYQREINDPHQESLENYIKNMKASAKYLPEVTLVCRRQLPISYKAPPSSLTNTQKGEILNHEYYSVDVKEQELYRIDGNHRIEAASNIYQQSLVAHEQNPQERIIDLYLPFAIILWTETQEEDGELIQNAINIDDEAFLFFVLNSKAKKLQIEDNYKGLVKSSTLKAHELDIADKKIKLLKEFNKTIENNNLVNKAFQKSRPLKQIAEILSKIENEISIEQFKSIIYRMHKLIDKNNWLYLKNNFKFYYQLIFYIAYMHSEEEECIAVLNNIENWSKKYCFDNTTFEDPILLYNNADKTNNLMPLNIFVAMAFDKDHINNFTEWIETAIKNIEEEKPKYKGRLHLNTIMTHRGYNIDLIDDIMQKIKECSIFIAEISTFSKKEGTNEAICDANPNVMYELGIAHNLNKPIILMREEAKFPNVPSDIQEKYRNSYNRNKSQETREILQKAIKAVIEDYYD
uniref:DGQHR domain-containing protein n=1 Tax=uncultured Candidatus Melainabacteria bacterium TaxID=2682970 RepID=A0A650EKW7_9BACT|nr:hypothetical protein Melaina855_1450 [uncultured Candidatus Melainabacteria bacterium]